MIYQSFSWISVAVALLGGVGLIFKRPYSLASFCLCAGLAAISFLTFLQLVLLGAAEVGSSERKTLMILEALMVILFYGYAKFAFRENKLENLGAGFWATCLLALGLLAYVMIVPTESLISVLDPSKNNILVLTKQGFAFYLLLMIFLVFALVQLERTMAALHQLQRYQVKKEIVGSGLLIMAFALYYSQSLLYYSININLIHLRSIVVIIAVALLILSRFFGKENSHLALSRGIAYRSFVLFIIGGYLILLGLVGEGLKYFENINYKDVYYLIILISSLLIFPILLSENLRRKVVIFLNKNFYQSKYDYRDKCESFAKLLSTSASSEDIQTSILKFYCDTFACKGAAFYLIDSETATYVNTSYFNFRRDWRPFTQDDPLICKMFQRDWIINLKQDNPELAGTMIETLVEVGAFLVIPLFFDEELTGFIVLGAQINQGEKLTYEDYDLLRLLGRQSIATVHGLRLSEQLSVTRELAAIGKVSTFVLHDLKNQVSGLSLLLDNADEYIQEPEFQTDMLETVRNTVDDMKGLIWRLKNLKEKPQLIIAPTDLKKIVDDAILTSGATISSRGNSVQLAADEEEIYKVVLNLLLNAVEASGKEDSVSVEYGLRTGQAFVEVTDCGCGMSAEFIAEKLFKPFTTTKKHGFGIGLYQCKQIIESHFGTITVASEEGQGTKFTLLLPLALKE